MITQAFILGAGLGTRLRPLTNLLPKPLVPLFHKPLAQWSIEACEAAGCQRFAINTHHLPEKWSGFLPDKDIRFFHEPTLLDTGGGLKQIESWIGEESILVHNGDIFSEIDLRKLIQAHESSDREVTLALRSNEAEKRITLDEAGRVIDLRSELLGLPGTHAFTGIYCAKKSFLKRIPPDQIISVIPAFQELARTECLASIVLDQGAWIDLGNQESYLAAHDALTLQEKIHPSALISPSAFIENSVIGKCARIDPGIEVINSVIWPNVHLRETVKGKVVIQ